MAFALSFGTLLWGGLFLILADRLHLPTLATTRAMISSGKKHRKLSQVVEAWITYWAIKAAPLVRLEEHRRGRLAGILRSAGIQQTPEVYTAYTLVKSGATLLLAIPCAMVFPIMVPVVAVLAVLMYFKESQKADEQLKLKREAIESELPRFVATIEQELQNSRDVLTILESYKRSAGDAFRQELDITCADMRSSGYEAALTRFEARLSSAMLSDVTRGLIGVLRGDDGGMYFKMLGHDFKAMELRKLKEKAQKIPPKVRVFSFIMLMLFLITYLVIIIWEIVKSLSGML